MTDIVPAGDSRMSFGQTKLDAADIIMPRVKLLQAQSAEVADGQGEAGEFFNTLTNVNYGKVLHFVPILPFKQRILLVRSEKAPAISATLTAAGLAPLAKEAAGLTCRSYNMVTGTGVPGIACATCPLSLWDETDQTPPHCSETYNVAASSDEGELIVLSFSKSSARAGRQLFSMIRMRPGAFVTLFEATSKTEKGGKGTYYLPVIKPGPQAAPELIRQAKVWASQLDGVTLDVTPEDVEYDGTPATPSGTDPF